MTLAVLLSLVCPPLCWSCGERAPPAAALCPDCRAGLRWLGRETSRAGGVETWAPVAYEGPARGLVRGLKFAHSPGLADPMAAQIAANAPPELLTNCQLVPVPLHPARLRRRGFNQAERLADALARRSGADVWDCLERRGARAPQAGRGRGERLVALGGTCAIRAGATVPRDPVLVDDVVTTGATLAACTEALRGGGARSVRAIAYARTLGR